MLISKKEFNKSKNNTFKAWKKRFDELKMFDLLAGEEEEFLLSGDKEFMFCSFRQNKYLDGLSTIYGENIINEFKKRYLIR